MLLIIFIIPRNSSNFTGTIQNPVQIFTIIKLTEMKQKLLTVLMVFCSIIIADAQPPQAFKYQAVVRNAGGELVANQAVGIRISIRNNDVSGPINYQETHMVTTNEFGLVNLNIGSGTPVGTYDFQSIIWEHYSKFLEVEVDPAGGSNYVSMGTSELLSVPYSLFSGGSADGYWDKSDADIYYNGGNVGVGTLSASAKLDIKASDIIAIKGNSTDNYGIEGSSSGVSVAGIIGQGLSANSWGVYGYNPYGGVAVRGYSAGGWAGYFSGNTYVSGNVGIGTASPAYPLHLISSSGINWMAGFHNTSTSASSNGMVVRADGGTPFMVQNSTKDLFTIDNYGSVGIGPYSPSYPLCVTSSTGTFYLADFKNLSTSSASHGLRISTQGGDPLVVIHEESVVFKIKKEGIVGIGTSYVSNSKVQVEGTDTYDAILRLNNVGTNGASFFMGSTNSAWGGGTNQDLFVMGHGAPSSANIDLAFNASGQIGIATTAPTQTLDVNGGGRYRGLTTGTVFSGVYMTSNGTLVTGSSDKRLKENIVPLQGSLEKVNKLQGVSFTWKANPEVGRSIGFIAQDFEKVVPELVFTNHTDGYMGINYAEVSALLVEAIKDQQKIIETLEKRIEALEKSADKYQ